MVRIEGGGVGFPVNEYLCDIMEVIEDTNSTKSYALNFQRHGTERLFILMHLYAVRVEANDERYVQKFGEVEVDAHKLKMLGEVVIA